MTLLEIFVALKQRLAAGQDCDDLLDNLSPHLNRFRPMLRNAFRGLLEDEDEIVSTVRTKIWAGVARFRGQTEGEAFNYCRTIVQREIVNYVRHIDRTVRMLTFRSTGKPPAPASESDPLEDDPDSLGADTEAGPDVLVAREEARLIERSLHQLNPSECELLWLNLIEDVQISEIARRSGETQEALSKRKERALAKLRRLLPEHLAEGRTLAKKRVGRGNRRRTPNASPAMTVDAPPQADIPSTPHRPTRTRGTAKP